VSEGYITSRVVATHWDSGDEVILNTSYINTSYTIDIDPFPDDDGESTDVSEVVPLRFPDGSQTGSYSLEARPTRARVATQLLGWLTVTTYLPASEEMGTVAYVAGAADEIITLDADINLPDYMDDSGAFLEDFIFGSEDGTCLLAIGEDTTALDEDGDPLDELTIDEMDDSPDPPQYGHIIGSAYRFGPSGASFDPPLTLTFAYDPTLLPAGASQQNLSLAMWDDDGEKWVVFADCIVDTGERTVTASVSHFTPFAILSYTRPAAFEVIDLTVNPATAGIGETVAVIPMVANSGDLAGTYEITLKINDVVAGTKEITLDGGSEGGVAFMITEDAAGSYTATVAGLSATFQITDAATPAPTTPTSGEPETAPVDAVPEESPIAVSWWRIALIITGITMAISIPMALRWRKGKD